MPGSPPTSYGCGSAGELQIPRRQADRDDVLLESYRPGQLHQGHVVAEVGGRVLRVYLPLLPVLIVIAVDLLRAAMLLLPFRKLLATRTSLNFDLASSARSRLEIRKITP